MDQPASTTAPAENPAYDKMTFRLGPYTGPSAKVTPSDVIDLASTISSLTRVCGLAVRDMKEGIYATDVEDLPALIGVLELTTALGHEMYHLLSNLHPNS